MQYRILKCQAIKSVLHWTIQTRQWNNNSCHATYCNISCRCNVFLSFFFFDRVTIFFISQNRQLAAKFVDMHFLFLVFSFYLYFICQRNEAGNSPAMEFMGFQRCMDFLLGCGLAITTFISDRHTQIASHMKNVLMHITHYFDLWHLKKSFCPFYLYNAWLHCFICFRTTNNYCFGRIVWNNNCFMLVCSEQQHTKKNLYDIFHISR